MSIESQIQWQYAWQYHSVPLLPFQTWGWFECHFPIMANCTKLDIHTLRSHSRQPFYRLQAIHTFLSYCDFVLWLHVTLQAVHTYVCTHELLKIMLQQLLPMLSKREQLRWQDWLPVSPKLISECTEVKNTAEVHHFSDMWLKQCKTSLCLLSEHWHLVSQPIHYVKA